MLLRELAQTTPDSKAALAADADWDSWEDQIVSDIKSGKLDAVIAQVEQEFADDETAPL